MTDHPCRGMSTACRKAFERIAIGQDSGIHPKTAERLHDAGLIFAHSEVIPPKPGDPAWLAVTVTRYQVSDSVLDQWGRWASENVKAEP